MCKDDALCRIGPELGRYLPHRLILWAVTLNMPTVEGEDEIDNMSLRMCVRYTGVK